MSISIMLIGSWLGVMTMAITAFDEDGVLAVFAHLLVVDDAGPGQKHHDERQLEHHSEGQEEQGDERLTYASTCSITVNWSRGEVQQPLEADGQDDVVAKDHAGQEEAGGQPHVREDVLRFSFSYSAGQDEGPELIQEEGQGA